jgi:hypothetical protein
VYTPKIKKAYRTSVGLCLYGAPGEIRTPDRLVRSQVLYPAELRALEKVEIIHKLAVEVVFCEPVSKISLIQGKIQGISPFFHTSPAKQADKSPLYIHFLTFDK